MSKDIGDFFFKSSQPATEKGDDTVFTFIGQGGAAATQDEEALFALMASLVVEHDGDTPHRLSAQEEALRNLKCDKPELGRWISRYDFPFLIETLTLDETIFSREFPGVGMSVEDRRALCNDLEMHCEDCERCHLKRGYDLEWQSRVNRMFSENKEVIGQAIARAVSKK